MNAATPLPLRRIMAPYDDDDPVMEPYEYDDDGPVMDPLDYASECAARQLLLCPSQMETRDWEALHARAEIELREIDLSIPTF